MKCFQNSFFSTLDLKSVFAPAPCAASHHKTLTSTSRSWTSITPLFKACSLLQLLQGCKTFKLFWTFSKSIKEPTHTMWNRSFWCREHILGRRPKEHSPNAAQTYFGEHLNNGSIAVEFALFELVWLVEVGWLVYWLESLVSDQVVSRARVRSGGWWEN